VGAARFCPNCGQPLVVRADERRVVTVLFADLVGFTSMAENADPEHVKNLVDRCFERLAADVAAFGGRVDKVIGDAILAIFGAPVAHEDDAERAVRAGLRMQASFSDWCRGGGLDSGLQLRVGVNTGEVLIGGMRAAGDWTAMGDTVNTANRLQVLAEPGTVVVGADTYAATVNAVRYTPLGALAAKGRAEPVEAWVAEETVAPPGRRSRRFDVPIVGRDDERSVLERLTHAATCRSRATTVVVIGEAGMGKTRLVEEAASRAEEEADALVLEGACVPYGEANVWWPVADAIRSALGAPIGTPSATLRTHCRAWVELALPAAGEQQRELVTEGLLHLFGEHSTLAGIDPGRAREEVSRSVVSVVEGLAAQRPVVVVLSDVHWADDAVLSLGATLMERCAHLPVVILATARAGLLERWRPTVDRSNQLILHLDPLNRVDTAALLEELASDLPADVRDMVLDRSGGNPFFLEELVRLFEDGGRTEVPHTLRGLVAARLDSLTPLERKIVESAAILGRQFPRMAVQLMAGGKEAHDGDGAGTSAVDAAIAELEAKDLLVDELDGILAFRSDLVREVAYGTLTKAARVQGHFAVADWIERHHLTSAPDRDRVAHHYATAASLVAEVGQVSGVPTDLGDRAVAALADAVEHAVSLDLYASAERLASQALELPPHTLRPADEARFLVWRARVRVGRRDADLSPAAADLSAAELLVHQGGAAVQLAEVQLAKGELELRRGDNTRAVDLLGQAVEVFRSVGSTPGEARALQSLGTAHLFGGEHVEAHTAFVDALDRSRQVGDRRGAAWATQNLAWVAYSAGQIDAAERYCAESRDTFESLGDRTGTAWADGLMGFVRYHQGRFAEAEALADQMLDLAHERDDPWANAMMLTLRGSLRLWTGRSAQAIEPAEQALAKFRSMGDWYGHLLAIAVVGRALVAQGRIEEGFAHVDEGVTVGGTTTSRLGPDIAAVHVVTSAAQAGRPDRVEGIELFTAADLDLHDMGFSDRAVSDGLVHLQRGDAERARDLLEALVAGLGERSSSYAFAALALARAAAGDLDAADAAASAVCGTTGATHSDRVMAHTSLGLVSARRGDPAGADAALGDVRAILEGTDERLGLGLLGLASATADEALGRPVAPGAGVEAAADSPGWLVAYRLVAGLS
jgi:class 3 adenylate cyclase/tetratricopeptide (TPR) repeat protein